MDGGQGVLCGAEAEAKGEEAAGGEEGGGGGHQAPVVGQAGDQQGGKQGGDLAKG